MLGPRDPLRSTVDYVDRAGELITESERYRAARQHLLHLLGLPASNREPLAEFAEHDHRHQHRGYGLEALRQVARLVRAAGATQSLTSVCRPLPIPPGK